MQKDYNTVMPKLYLVNNYYKNILLIKQIMQERFTLKQVYLVNN